MMRKYGVLLVGVQLVVSYHYLVAVVAGTSSDTQASKAKVVSQMLDSLLAGYNKEFRPGLGGERVVIFTDILIKSMGPISESDMSYSMQVYFRQRWRDDRLTFHLPNITKLTLSSRFISHIWRPNSYFLNGRHSKQHNITAPNAFIRLSYDGSIYMSVRLTVNARCPMMLSRYPMDKVVCPLFIGSFGYTTDDLVYRWENQVDIDPGVTLSQFELGKIEQQNISKKSKLGELSVLQVYIHMSRAVGFYVLQTYVPCCLIVSLSWISFWINRDAAPARVLLGVTTILSTAAIGITVREGLPRVPYATALDVFLNVCIVYEMAALIEYAAVNYFTKLMPTEGGAEEEEGQQPGVPVAEAGTRANKKMMLPSSGQLFPESETLLRFRGRLEEHNGKGNDKLSRRCRTCLFSFLRCMVGDSDYREQRTEAAHPGEDNSVSHIDMVARVLFPLTFIAFNLCYWLLYVYLEVS